MSKGLLESLLEGVAMNAAVQASKDANGKPNPYKAAGMLYGAKGTLTDSDLAELGTILGAEGAFDELEQPDFDYGRINRAIRQKINELGY